MRQAVTYARAMEGPLVLVNPGHSLCAQPAPGHLAPAPGAAGILLRRQAAVMLSALLDAIGAAGRIVAVSGYRSNAEQRALYAGCMRDNGPEFTQKYVALPGCSEHETGLAIDVGEARGAIDFLRPAFPYTGVCGRFRREAARYGFIERYPAGAEHITRIAHEPWHFRYVGWPHAGLIARRGCTLEEYVEYLRGFSPQRPLRVRADGRAFTIFRVPLSLDGAGFEAPDGCVWQASADNDGGAVITLWCAA